ncbi:MAG: hypothetical protein WCW33_05395 [Candidatus Babeliales bacterium]
MKVDKIDSGKELHIIDFDFDAESNSEFEDIYKGELLSIESSIIRIYRQQPGLIDGEVLIALDAVILTFKSLNGAFSERPFSSSLPAQMVYEAVKKACEELLQALPVVKDGEALKKDEILACLKRIRSSVRYWNKEMGRQGYLNFVRKFV